ncbi:MAG: TrkH family potassium uptake protein [Dissulfuribacterales bacterium]
MLKSRFNPSQILLLGFTTIIGVGAILLKLPISTRHGISTVDALFTATSAVCVTGLIVKNTPVDFTLFGQIVILLLIQIGGLGYMTSTTLIFLMMGKKIDIKDRFLLKESMNLISMEGVVKFVKHVLTVTLIIELRVLLLSFCFLPYMPWRKAVYYGLFHSISAFNNAGFSLFPDNLMKFKTSMSINLIISLLIIAGGIGFLVLWELKNRWNLRAKDRELLSMHAKTVLGTTGLLILAGAVLILLFERNNPDSMAGLSLPYQFLAAFFASITARTAGFNTLDYASLTPETLFLTIVLMFIGASPGGTGGGVKTTTIAVVLTSMFATIRGEEQTVLFKRAVPSSVISKSMLIVVLGAIFVIVASILILHFENSRYLSILFEVTSAIGTVGLSVGDGGVRSLSATFSPLGKMIISFIMLAGRIGPLTLACAFFEQKGKRYRYPKGRIAIG